MGQDHFFAMPLALGANVAVAQLIGRGDAEGANRAVHTALVLALVFGVLAAAAVEVFCPAIMRVMLVPEAVLEPASDYLRVYFLGLPFISVYNFLVALFRSDGDTATPLAALFAASGFNIAGDFLFLQVFDMGAGGVALATVLANAHAAGILLARQMRMKGVLRIEIRRLLSVDRGALSVMLRVGFTQACRAWSFRLQTSSSSRR